MAMTLPSSAPADSQEWLAEHHARLKAAIRARPRPEGEHDEHERIVVTIRPDSFKSIRINERPQRGERIGACSPDTGLNSWVTVRRSSKLQLSTSRKRFTERHSPST
jgi:hypothetical protein